jgi:hypothetical protein
MRKLLAWFNYERSLLALVILNMLDAISTHWALKLRVAEEVNPIMRWAWNQSPDLFWILKMGFVAIAILLLGAFAPEKVARQTVLAGCGLYAVIILIHLVGWVALLLS